MPLFNRNRAGDDEFVDAAPTARVTEDEMTTVQIRGRKLILTRHEGVVYAIDSACPHAAADLSKGSLRRWRICCHEHDYCFDIRSGRLVFPEDEPYRLRRFEVREEDGRVMVRLSPAKTS